ncbi:Uncharacterised protein [BD1-7 clade bacterium]|uniref:Probable membrane transporter protein n=1 Tax=BD1-7 clade bacterium TaxID=2029982 RepID=A0A5S9PNN5_9GAMM|nr:Uncharacterised protein [BD1-7 clade bacterium]
MPEYAHSPLFWFIAVIGVLLTGISKTGFAGGAGVLAVPLLALIVPVPIATALVLPLLWVMDIRNTSYFYRSIDWSETARILPAAVLGIAVGGILLDVMSENLMQTLLGAFCILFAIWNQLVNALGRLPGSTWIWGSISGLTSTLLHAGGPPMTIYFIAKKTPKSEWLATTAVVFLIMNWLKAIPYALNGELSGDFWWVVLALLPVALIGVALGYQIQKVLNEALFSKVCRLLLLGSGIMLVFKGFL